MGVACRNQIALGAIFRDLLALSFSLPQLINTDPYKHCGEGEIPHPSLLVLLLKHGPRGGVDPGNTGPTSQGVFDTIPYSVPRITKSLTSDLFYRHQPPLLEVA